MAPFIWNTSAQTSWFHRWWSSLTTFGSNDELGTVWQSNQAPQAFETKQLASQPSSNGAKLRLCFRNATPLSLILCWISDSGKPHHFYKLKPSTSSSIVLDNNALLVTDDNESDHVETTQVGHAFCIALDERSNNDKKQLSPSNVIGGYRPESVEKDSRGQEVHVVTISQASSSTTPSCYCCPSWGTLLRGRRANHKKDDSTIISTSEDEGDFIITVTRGVLDSTPLDTSNKIYEETTLGGWPVHVESNWHGGDTKLQQRLESDLQYASSCLPLPAREFLQQSTPIYINRTQKYGPKACPTKGKGLCFHPHKQWLCDNGMSPQKHKCIELYDSSDYLEDCQQWGPGGVLLHELCHAYHYNMCKNGYDNTEIKKCYQQAMKDGLYERVECHSRNGKKEYKRAYACTNHMEYFAELSTAFLGGLDDDENQEYNKWFPYCRSQLKHHDPRAYSLLQRIWNVDCNESDNEH